MGVCLYVDDLRDCPPGFWLARTFEEAIAIIQNHPIDIVSLDHDLGMDENGNERKNGYDLIKYFCEHGLYAQKMYMHTDNVVGRQNMVETLRAAQRRGFIADDIEIYHYPITKNVYSGEAWD